MPSVSKKQRKLFGMVHACQKYGKCASEKISDIAHSIKPKDAEDFAKTKETGLPEKKKRKTFKEWLAENYPTEEKQ